MIKHTIVNKFDKTTMYQGKLTICYSTDNLGTDRIGTLKRVECSKIGMFEAYKMSEIKQKINELFINQ
jgi:hypothetical protein